MPHYHFEAEPFTYNLKVLLCSGQGGFIGHTGSKSTSTAVILRPTNCPNARCKTRNRHPQL